MTPDPVLIDLARYERDQDAEDRREDYIDARAVELAAELLTHEPEMVVDALISNGPRGLEWERLTRDLARTAVRERDYRRPGIANDFAELLWQTAREMGRMQAEGEL